MNVAIKSSPFQREVREWQRVDPNTGALMSGRLQADRWNNGSANKYGKVVDSQHISTPNGTRLQQHKEMEILQARTVSGSLQVVRSTTVQKSSSRTTINTSNALRSSPIFAIEEVQSTLGNYEQDTRGQSPLVTSPGGSPILGYERGRSASTEDVVNSVGLEHPSDDDEEPRDWRRVSKIRRSLQYPKATVPRFSSRPTDLPINLVNVSKIKRDLESNSPSSPCTSRKLDFEDASSEQEHSESKQQLKKKTTLITTDSLAGIRNRLKRLSDESLYKEDMVTTPESTDTTIENTLRQTSHPVNPRVDKPKLRDTNPTDWYLRRKSYGFEEMPAQQQKSMSRMESSTDSGLGRSGEISSVWPSTLNDSRHRDEPPSKPRGTIITLSGLTDEPNSSSPSRVLINSSSPKVYHRSFRSAASLDPKRHSIAVDDSNYVGDSKILVKLNGNGPDVEYNTASGNLLDESGKRMRRVEFCKTEVHFAAESGRVNIVETDGKPPSTNNFRRRRRSSTSYSDSLVNSTGTVLMHFGDAERLGATSAHVSPTAAAPEQNQVRVTVAEPTSSISGAESSAEKPNSREEEEVPVDEISLRGILKNKPVKPRPYHLGDNLESTERLWGVRLKPIGAEDENNDDAVSLIDNNKPEYIELSNGFATRVNLYPKTSNRPWATNETNCSNHHTVHLESPSNSDSNSVYIKSIIKIPTSDSANLKSTSLIMQTIKTTSHQDESHYMHNNHHHDSAPIMSHAISYAEPLAPVQSNQKNISIANSCSTSSVQSDGSVYQINNLVSNSSSSSTLSAEPVPPPPIVQPVPVHLQPHRIDRTVNGKPIAAPRIKKIGSSTTAGLSHQLSQLRRIYEAADLETLENELVDNEVKLYLGGTDESGDEQPITMNGKMMSNTEVSGSWSRVKAQRHVVPANDWTSEKDAHTGNEPRNSNRLSIVLHSPTESTASFELKATKPIAKPRTSIAETTNTKTTLVPSTNGKTFGRSTLKTAPTTTSVQPKVKVALKPANGARKLRQHELSYFGLNVSSSVIQAQNDTIMISSTTTPRPFNQAAATGDGKLISDKPDLLLNHTPVSSNRVQLPLPKYPANGPSESDPIYENVNLASDPNKRPTLDRVGELRRDEQNLRELNEVSLANSSALSEKKHSPQTRRSASKPFDTIREEGATGSGTPKTMLSKGVQVSRGYNHTLNRIKPLHRTSSASSSESIISVGRSRRSSAEKYSSSQERTSPRRSQRVPSSDEGETGYRSTRSFESTTHKSQRPKDERQPRSSSTSKRSLEKPDDRKSRKPSAVKSTSSKENVRTSTTSTEVPRSTVQKKPQRIVVVRPANYPQTTTNAKSHSAPPPSATPEPKSHSSSGQRRSHRSHQLKQQ